MAFEQREYKGGAVVTALSSGIGSGDLSISIDDATGWPTGGVNGPFFITIDRDESTEERVEVASRSGTTLTVASVSKRGVDDTSAVSHNVGASVRHTDSAQDFAEANTHITDTSRDDHSQYHDDTRHAAITHTQAMLGALSVGTAQLIDDSVTAAKLASGAVTPPQVDVFTASGTWNKPSGATAVLVRVQAGGGAGGGAPVTAAGEVSVGGGGGAGGYSEELHAAGSLGATETVTVGSGGTGSAGSTGGNGGNSSFGTHTTANGGTGGAAGTADTTSMASGGAGGAATADAVAAAGGGGTVGTVVGAQSFFGIPAVGAAGAGGHSAFGGGGHGAITGSTGGAGSRGGGGAGAINSESEAATAGRDGGDGIVIATTFF